MELWVEANLTSTWQMTAVYAGGDYRYASRPLATITRNNSAEVFASNRTVYWENYKVGGIRHTQHRSDCATILRNTGSPV